MGHGPLQHQDLAAMNNEEIFLEFWRNYQWPEPKSSSYRLYHDDEGKPLFYTMEDLPGKYVEVTAEQYARASFRVRVVDRQVVELESKKTIRKLVPSATGTRCHPQDVTIVVNSIKPNQAWKKR